MPKGFKGAGVLLLVVMFAGLVWTIFFREPSYEGRPLNSWLRDLDDQHPGPANDRAEEAIRRIGDDAMPEIIRVLKFRDSSLKYKLSKWAYDHHLLKSAPIPAIERHHHAVVACYVLGPRAKLAIPALIALLNDGYTYGYVGGALGSIGPEALSPMIVSLTNTNDRVRVELVHSLGDFRSNAPVVVPVLIRHLNDNSMYVQTMAAMSIGQIAREPALAIPALMDCLEGKNTQVRWCACIAISKFHEEAAAAKPRLFSMLEEDEPYIRATAAIALARIEPHNSATIEKVMPYLIEDVSGIKNTSGQDPMKFHALNFRYDAIQALENCGSLARPAVPALMECLKADELIVRDAATNALKAIGTGIQ